MRISDWSSDVCSSDLDNTRLNVACIGSSNLVLQRRRNQDIAILFQALAAIGIIPGFSVIQNGAGLLPVQEYQVYIQSVRIIDGPFVFTQAHDNAAGLLDASRSAETNIAHYLYNHPLPFYSPGTLQRKSVM